MKEDFCTQLENGSLRFVRDLPGPMERVWTYLADPEKRAVWFADGTMGQQPGDEFIWDFTFDRLSGEDIPERWADHDGIRSHARIVEIRPPELLVVIGIEDPQEIRFELKARGDRVELTLVQAPPPGFEGLVVTAAGWQACLGLLADHLSGTTVRGFWSEHEAAEGHYRRLLAETA